MTIKWTRETHPRAEAFEEYSFERLSPESTAEFEEHLLICEQCQLTLAETDEYIRLMKAATEEYGVWTSPPTVASHPARHGLHWNAAAAAAILLTCLTALLSWRTPADPKTIALEAYRGGEISSTAPAPAGRPLDLNIDLHDLQPVTGYRVEVVDSVGHRVWFGGTPAHLAKGLAPGIYWVRLSADTGKPLREFGLNVR